MSVFKTKIDIKSEDYKRNSERMRRLVGDLKEKMKNTSIGGNEKARKKQEIAREKE